MRKKKPNLVFLSKTKLRQNKIEVIRCKLGYHGLFVVDCNGRSGRLALLWDSETEMEIQNFSQHHINAIITVPTNTLPWKLTGFYGHPVPAKSHTTWSLLKILAQFEPLPWACIGDFNEVLTSSEKWGGNVRHRHQMQDFQQALEDCELTDLGFYGPKFTLRNCREREDFIKERLDRGVANQAWRDMFPIAELQVEIAIGSDHYPIILHPTGTARDRRYGPKFRHEASWTLEEEYPVVIKQVWEQPDSGGSHWDKLGVKLMGCRRALVQWQKKKKKGPKNHGA